MIYDEATARQALSSLLAVSSDDVGVYATVSKAVQQSLEGLIGHKVNGLQSACAEVRRKCQLFDGDKKTLAHIRDLQAAAAFSRHFTRLGRLAWMDEVESLIARLKTSPEVATDCSSGSQAVKKKKLSSKQRRAQRLAKDMVLDLDLHDEWADGQRVLAGVVAVCPQPADVAACSAQAEPARATRKLDRASSGERTPKRAAPGLPADEDQTDDYAAGIHRRLHNVRLKEIDNMGALEALLTVTLEALGLPKRPCLASTLARLVRAHGCTLPPEAVLSDCILQLDA